MLKGLSDRPALRALKEYGKKKPGGEWGQEKDLDFYLTLDFHFIKDIKESCYVAKAGLEFTVFLPLGCFNYGMQPHA